MTKGTNNTAKKQDKQEISIEGIDNLYFIPLSEHGRFKDELTAYLKADNIKSKGVITQVGNVLEKADNGFIYFLYVPAKDEEIYLKGEYDLFTKEYVYGEEKDIKLLEDIKNPVCAGVDEQEAPEPEFTDMPVVI